MSTFQPGQKCVCILNGPWYQYLKVTILGFQLPIKRRIMKSGPKKDEICFINDTRNDAEDGQVLNLKGYEHNGWYVAYNFRPMTFGDQIVEELEKSILDPTPEIVEK